MFDGLTVRTSKQTYLKEEVKQLPVSDQRFHSLCSFNETWWGCVASADRISRMYEVTRAAVCVCVCVLSTCAVKYDSRLVRRPDVARKRRGRPPQHTYIYTYTHTYTLKCGFIAASLGQRAGGVSLPHGTIISWAQSTERNMARRQRGRGRAKDRDETQSGRTLDDMLHFVFH